MAKEKSIFSSKTFWVNTLGLIAMLVQSQTGFIVSAEAQAAALTIINMILRMVTKEAVSLNIPSGKAPTVLIIVLASSVIMTSCAGNKANQATNTMLIMRETVISIADAANDMCEQAILDQSECDKIGDIYEKAQVTYDAAADLLIISMQAKDVTNNWETFQLFHNKFLVLYQDIYNVAIEFEIIPVIERGTK